MENQFERTERLLGADAMTKLRSCKVAVFGVGGVGGYCVEALVRSGIGSLDLIDSDTVCLSNLNRQIIATHKTIGMYKVDAAAERAKDINPDVEVNCRRCFFLPENAGEFDFSKYDYVIDAVDTVTAKIEIAVRASEAGVPVISAMGAGNKLDPTGFMVTDIFETKIDPLAKVMRRELKKRGIRKLKVVYSEEQPLPVHEAEDEESAASEDGQALRKRRATPGSCSFVPSAAGLVIAGAVIRDLCGIHLSAGGRNGKTGKKS